MIPFKATLKPLELSSGNFQTREEAFTEDLNTKVRKLTEKSINSFGNANVSISKNVRFASSFAPPVNGYIYGTYNYVFFALPSISSLKLNQIKNLTLDISYAFNLVNLVLDTSPAPTSSFSVPIYLNIGKWDWRSTGEAFTPFICTPLTNFEWANDVPPSFIWDNRQTFNLSNTITTRNFDITNNVYDFSTDSGKLTQAQYNLFTGNEPKNFMAGFVLDLSVLSGDNLTFMNNNLASNLEIQTTLNFSFFGSVANFDN
jgi:hypothetical protein